MISISRCTKSALETADNIEVSLFLINLDMGGAIKPVNGRARELMRKRPGSHPHGSC
jgi:hypothetical protein